MTYQLRLHDFGAERNSVLSDRPMSRYELASAASAYHAARPGSARVSAADTSYGGGLRSRGMDSMSYLQSLLGARGYKAPEPFKGEYKECGGPGTVGAAPGLAGVPSISLGSMQGIGK